MVETCQHAGSCVYFGLLNLQAEIDKFYRERGVLDAWVEVQV